MTEKIITVTNGKRKADLYVTGNGVDIDVGGIFTLDGYGLSKHGHEVVNGKSVKTGRKMKVYKLKQLKITAIKDSVCHSTM